MLKKLRKMNLVLAGLFTPAVFAAGPDAPGPGGSPIPEQLSQASFDYLRELERAMQQSAQRDSGTVLPDDWLQLARGRAQYWAISETEAIERTRSLYNKKAGLVRSSSRGTAGSNVIRVGGDLGGACDFFATSNDNGLQQALDAANSGANAGSTTEIRVARSGDYSGRRYFINDSVQGDQSITVVGGYQFCGSAQPDPDQPTTLDLDGITGGSGIEIGPNASSEIVVLENFVIENGNRPFGDGGGLSINNNNFVILRNTRILSSSAVNGGGVSITGVSDGEQTALWVLDGSSISFNTAGERGGGLYCDGANSVVFDTLVAVTGNQADQGGGIFVENGCNAVSYASLPGGIFENNADDNGGGVYVVGMDSVFTLNGGENNVFGFGDASVTGIIDNNAAGNVGGGIFAGNSLATGTNEQINVLDGWVVSNQASNSGGGLYLQPNASLAMERRLPGEQCHNPTFCSRIASNLAPSAAAIRVVGGDDLSSELIDIRQTWITGNANTNSGFSPIINIGGSSDSGIELLMEGNVIAQNQVQDGGAINPINLLNVDDATIAFTTITDNNSFAFDAAIRAVGQGDLNVFSSIVHEDFGSVFDATFGSGLSGQTDCLLVHEDSSQPPQSSQIFTGDPGFDGTPSYSLGRNSAAIDICDTGVYAPQENDILGEPRGVDIALVDNQLGPYDLGANERTAQIGPLQAFVTSLTGSGDLSTWADAGGQAGVQAADGICQARAQAANLPEPASFVAWVSDSNDDAYCRIHGLTGKRDDNCGQGQLPSDAGPWIRTDGQPFAESIDLALVPNDVTFLPPRVDEFGNEIFSLSVDRLVRTGTVENGSATTSLCSDWTSESGIATVGNMNYVASGWGFLGSSGCGGQMRLLCMERGPGPALSPFGDSGKIVFASSATGPGDLASWSQADPGSSGIVAGDSICRNLAGDAGLPNAEGFKAWLSDDDTAAPARISSEGPWIRPDGVLVAADKSQLLSSFRNTGIAVTEHSDYVGSGVRSVWTGTGDDGVPESDNCNNWQDASGSFEGVLGSVRNSAENWSRELIRGCGFSSARLYCIEDVGPDRIFGDRFEP